MKISVIWLAVGLFAGMLLYNNAGAIQCYTQTYLIHGKYVSCMVCHQPNGNVTTTCN